MKAHLTRIWDEISRDKRKLSLGLILVGIALLLWGRLLLKQVPQAAVADPSVKAAATPPGSDRPSARTSMPAKRPPRPE